MDTPHVRSFHAPNRPHAAFDDEHVIGYAGLVPAMRLAERCDLAALVGECVAIGGPDGANAYGYAKQGSGSGTPRSAARACWCAG
jgi:hypothetical protein